MKLGEWVWKFPRYQYTFNVGAYRITRYLGFFTYWLIRWTHGAEKLEKLGNKLSSWERK